MCRACPTDVLEMVIWEDCRAGQIASAPYRRLCWMQTLWCLSNRFWRTRLFRGETTRSMGLAY
jgi:photosystem I subunit 7